MRHPTRFHLIAGATCVFIAGAIGLVVPTPPADLVGANRSHVIGEDCGPTALLSYRSGEIVWDSCGLAGGESGAQYRGRDGSTLYSVRYDFESSDVARRALAESLSGQRRSGTAWDVRRWWKVGDIWIAEFNTPFPLPDEPDRSRWPLYACAQLDGVYVDVVYGPTRDGVIAFHNALAEANSKAPAGTAPN